MSWRYQPVWFDEPDGGKAFGMITVHFDDAGRLDGWTESHVAPIGEDIDDLNAEIVHLLMDAQCWKPVAYKDLTPGLQFEARVTMEERKGLADFIDAAAGDLGKYSSKTAN